MLETYLYKRKILKPLIEHSTGNVLCWHWFVIRYWHVLHVMTSLVFFTPTVFVAVPCSEDNLCEDRRNVGGVVYTIWVFWKGDSLALFITSYLKQKRMLMHDRWFYNLYLENIHICCTWLVLWSVSNKVLPEMHTFLSGE